MSGAGGTGCVRTERRGERVALLAIHRPAAANAIDEAVLRDLDVAFAVVQEDARVRAAVLTGDGDVFSAGGDVRAMQAMTVAEGRGFVELGHRVMDRIAGSDVVTVAAVNGAALGGGAELALACDLRVAAEGAVLGWPEVRLGLYPAWGGTQRATRVLGPARAKLLMLTGDRVDAAEALRLGLVDRVTPADEVVSCALGIAERVAAASPSAVRQTKMAIGYGGDGPLAAGLRLEIEGWMVNFTHPDRVEGLSAYLEHREPQWLERVT